MGQRIHEGPLRLIVQGRCSLIHHQHFRVIVKRPRYTDALTLSTRKAHTPFADPCLKPLGQTADKIIELGQTQRFPDPCLVDLTGFKREAHIA